MNNYIKVKDRPDLVRDKGSKAILNTDLSSLDKYKQERQRVIENRVLAEDYKNLKNEISDIRCTMNRVLELLDKVVGS